MASTCLWAETYTPADVPNPKTEGQQYYVSNPDDILADSSVIWLNTCASMLESKTNVELCVVALESIDDADAFDFAYEFGASVTKVRTRVFSFSLYSTAMTCVS